MAFQPLGSQLLRICWRHPVDPSWLPVLHAGRVRVTIWMVIACITAVASAAALVVHQALLA